MSSRFLSFLALICFFATICASAPASGAELRVCADPANLPFSDRSQRGFENRIAEVVARDLGLELRYKWQRMGRGFVRNVLNGGECDLLIGIPSKFRPVLTTSPYYRSSYVFVTRKNRRLRLTSLDDPQLRKLKIGVQIADEEFAPPGQALARRGIVTNVKGFETVGDDAPLLVRAVANGDVDVAIAWGPLAGYFAKRYAPSLDVTPVSPEFDEPGLPMTFEISMGVRKSDADMRDRVQGVLSRRQGEIRAILQRYGVPLLPLRTEQARAQ